MRDGSS